MNELTENKTALAGYGLTSADFKEKKLTHRDIALAAYELNGAPVPQDEKAWVKKLGELRDEWAARNKQGLKQSFAETCIDISYKDAGRELLERTLTSRRSHLLSLHPNQKN